MEHKPLDGQEIEFLLQEASELANHAAFARDFEEREEFVAEAINYLRATQGQRG